MDPSTSNESRAALPIAVVVVTLTIAAIAVVLRTYTRLVLIKQIGIDDAAVIISLVGPQLTGAGSGHLLT